VSVFDLYGGRTAETYDDGFVIMNDIGLDQLQQHAVKAAATVEGEVVLAGNSMGGAMAAHVWQTRPRTKGVLFLAGPGSWPGQHAEATPVQMHAARPDPFDDEDVFTEWETENPGAELECFRCGDVGHLFLDCSHGDFDADANLLCRRRCAEFLASL
jgi:dienelactone hydrolase